MVKRIGIVVPTYKEELFEKFVNAWDWSCNSKETGYELTLYIVEDQAKKFVITPNLDINIKHFSWREIDKDLKDKAWVIPRRSSGIRSYGYLKAWQDGMDYVLTLDDDCFPKGDDKHIRYLAYQHIVVMNKPMLYTQTYSVGDLFYPGSGLFTRGYPYRYRVLRNSFVSVGGWNKNPDLDAIDQLQFGNKSINVQEKVAIVPKNLAVTMCGMNVMFHRDLVPIMYFLLQSKEHGVERCDDIWAGFFAKKVLDTFDSPMVINGLATVHHDRASDPVKNLFAEAPSLPYTEFLWDNILPLQLDNTCPLKAYKDLAKQLKPEWFPTTEYGENLKGAMTTWINLFLQP